MKYYKWAKVPPTTETLIEVTKDYFAEGDEYINEENGWIKLEDKFIEIKDENEKDN